MSFIESPCRICGDNIPIPKEPLDRCDYCQLCQRCFLEESRKSYQEAKDRKKETDRLQKKSEVK